MGWNRGVDLFESLIGIILDKVDDEGVRVEMYRDMIEIFEAMDCDDLGSLYEATDDDAFDTAYNDLYPKQVDYEDE